MNLTARTSVALPQSRPNLLARRAAIVLLGSLLVAICAHISIPLWFTPVPLTLQTFAVLFLGLVLSPGVATSALVAYLLEGVAGLPVFSPVAAGGFLHLFGPTGGYLMAYPAAAALTALLRRRVGKQGFGASLCAAGLGSLLILVAGAAWLSIVTHQSPATVITLAVVPFLAGDILKVIAAAGAAAAIGRFRPS